MKINKKYLSVFSPIIISLVFVGGLFVGNWLKIGNPQKMLVYSQPSKLDLLMRIISTEYVDPISKDSLEEMVMPKVLHSLDPHSSYIPASDVMAVQEPLQGNFEGIGIEFNIKEDTIYVVHPIPGGPSEKVGILAGDKIVTINDSLFAGIGIKDRDVLKNLKGKRGTKVRVGIKRRNVENLLDFEIIRDKIPIYSVDIAYMITKEVGYIKIERFSQTTSSEFIEGIKDLKQQGMKKLILDLRSNGGGYLHEAVRISDELLPDGKMIVYTEGQARKKDEYFSSSKGEFTQGDLVILIDPWSASASEIVSGAIQDNDRGTIIGQRSFGKGLVQESTMFKDSSVVRLTIARYHTPTGRCIQKPYDGEPEDYELEVMHRFENGELEIKDSVFFNEKLKYETPGGRIVYGGGGIMPDVFVPYDTIYRIPIVKKINRKSLIYTFALDYSDIHRNEMQGYDNAEALSRYLDEKDLIQEFVAYANEKGIDMKVSELVPVKDFVAAMIKARIARAIINNKGFFPIANKVDVTLQKALEVLAEKEAI